MKTVTQMAAQGDMIIRRTFAVPTGAVEVQRDKGKLVLAHSETGHHHAVDSLHARMYSDPKDPLICYLQMETGVEQFGGVDVVHHRAWDTHETLRLLGKPGDVWEVRRQREWTPEGWRRVED